LIWIGLFLVSMVASLFVIIGKMVDWSVVLRVPLAWARRPDLSLEVVPLLNALVVMALALVVFRAVAVGNGIISLLRLSAELAISEAQQREDERHKAAEQQIANMSQREHFGSYVELPSQLPSSKAQSRHKPSARQKN
jgi:cell division protein FtsB